MAVSAGELDDDRALVYAVQQGDTEAYSALFRRHYPAVRKACARRLGNVVEADEMAQAAFVRALERISQCQGDRRFGPWVHVIARYLCIDATRARAKVTPEEEPVPEDRSGGGLPEDGILDLERRRAVRLALDQLPERQRDVVIARTFENRRPVEIAASLGLSVAAVDSLLLRARRGLALAYERVAGEGGAAATVTSASAASALGGTLAVGPSRVVEGMASAGQAITNAAGDMASLPPVRGLGATVASAVMAAGLALTGSAPTTPVTPQAVSPVASADPAEGALGLPGLDPSRGGLLVPSTSSGAGSSPAAVGEARDAGSALGSIVGQLSPLVPPAGSSAAPADDGSSSIGTRAPLAVPISVPELDSAVNGLTNTLGLPPVGRSSQGPTDETVTGAVGEVTDSLGNLGGLLPGSGEGDTLEYLTTLVGPPSGSSSRQSAPAGAGLAPLPVPDLTGTVGDLLR